MLQYRHKPIGRCAYDFLLYQPDPDRRRSDPGCAQGSGNYGYNAQSGVYGDMVEMGVLDPTKVTRTALMNAASVASLILTTDCMVADLPVEEKPMPPMGGMDGMPGMM